MNAKNEVVTKIEVLPESINPDNLDATFEKIIGTESVLFRSEVMYSGMLFRFTEALRELNRVGEKLPTVKDTVEKSEYWKRYYSRLNLEPRMIYNHISAGELASVQLKIGTSVPVWKMSRIKSILDSKRLDYTETEISDILRKIDNNKKLSISDCKMLAYTEKAKGAEAEIKALKKSGKLDTDGQKKLETLTAVKTIAEEQAEKLDIKQHETPENNKIKYSQVVLKIRHAILSNNITLKKLFSDVMDMPELCEKITDEMSAHFSAVLVSEKLHLKK